MKVLKIYNQMRRDCWCDLECEGCGGTETIKDAYDDSYYWSSVIPNRECKLCHNSTNSFNLKPTPVQTRYPDGEQH